MTAASSLDGLLSAGGNGLTIIVMSTLDPDSMNELARRVREGGLIMVSLLARNWKLLALRGAVAVLFGIILLLYPLAGLAALLIVFGAFSLADGVFAVAAAIANRRDEPYWGSLLVSGLVGIGIGLVALFWPRITALAFVYIIAFWAVVVGIGEILAAVRLRKLIRGEWLLALAGVLTVLFGVLIAIFPGAGALALIAWIAVFALLSGVLLLVLAFRLRRWAREVADPAP